METVLARPSLRSARPAISRRVRAVETIVSSVKSVVPSVPVGVIKRFGNLGPAYEVGAVTRCLDDGDWMVSVTLVESQERVEYRVERMLADPLAA